MILPAEILHGVTFGLMYAAGVEYTHKVAPPGMIATLQGVFNGVYYGLGAGSGAIVGGIMWSSIGLRQTFLYVQRFLGGRRDNKGERYASGDKRATEREN